MSKDNIKTSIILVIIFGLCIGLIFIIQIEKNSDKLKKVDMPNMYFMVINYVNSYINALSSKDNDMVYNMLYDDYKNRNDFYLFDNIKTYDAIPSVDVTNIEYLEKQNNYIFYVEATIYNYTMNKKEVVDDEFAIIIIMDNTNKTFAIYPTERAKYQKDLNKIKKININKNNNNELIPMEIVGKEKMCILYMTDFINKINNSDDYGYNLLNSNMIEKYSNLKTYKDTIIKKKDKLSTVASKCAVEKANTDNENNKRYTVIDSNNNKFIFTESAVMNYKVDFYFEDEYEKEE